MYIYVLDIHGRPLMPTRRAGRVRRMLSDRRAVVASHEPFTIRLTYETTSFTQPVDLGVDAGSLHVGVSACTESHELYTAQVDLRADIVENLSTRREARRTRRNRLRYRAPRFDNRRRPDGWLAPSTGQKVQQNVRAALDVLKILPVTKVTVEAAQFDMQWIKNPGLTGTDYQHGEQYGFWNAREYILWRDSHQCQCCHGKSKDPVLNVHHIESRRTGGDSPGNLVTLCETCHGAYHKGKIALKLERNFASLRDAAAMNVMRWNVYEQLKSVSGIPVRLTYGYVTKHIRIGNGLEKDHAVDARCISGHPAAGPAGVLFRFRKLRRHNRKVMKSNLLKGGRWKRNHVPGEIRGFRLFDIVSFQNAPAYIHGRRSSGFFVIKDTEGHTVSNSVSCKKLRLKRHSDNSMFYIQKRNGPIPPTNEFVGFLGHLS